MIRFMQVNLNHCWLAHQLLAQVTLERAVDVVLVSDPVRNPIGDERWVASDDGGCAVMLGKSTPLVVMSKGAGDGYAWARAGEACIVSCYCPPRWDVEKFSRLLDEPTVVITTHLTDGVLVVGGDFNAHSAEWGSTFEDWRGRELSDFAAALGLIIANEGTTFRRMGRRSMVDVTQVRITPGVAVNDWQVFTELDSASDHLYLEYQVVVPGGTTNDSRLITRPYN